MAGEENIQPNKPEFKSTIPGNDHAKDEARAFYDLLITAGVSEQIALESSMAKYFEIMTQDFGLPPLPGQQGEH